MASGNIEVDVRGHDLPAVKAEIEALRAENARLRASQRSAWNAAIERDERLERLTNTSPYIGATVVVAGRVEAWFLAVDAAEDWAVANCPNGYSICEA